jgi:prevent-host-death family protein
MTIASASELKQKTAEILDRSQQEAVLIRRHARDAAVLTSVEEYEEYRRLKTQELMRLCQEISKEAEARGLTEEILERLLADDSDDDAE